MTDKRKQQIEALEQFFKKVQESHPFGLGDHEDYELIRSLLEDLKGEPDERFTREELEVAFEDGQDYQMQLDNGVDEEQRLTFDRSLQYILEERSKKPPQPSKN